MEGTEILAPAGSEETAYAALDCGAGAIYLGMKEFSARASAENFDTEALSRVSAYAHMLGAKVYVALNTLVKDSETGEFFRTAKEVYNAGADAILIQDMFLGSKLHKLYPEISLHLSTQAGCCNEAGARLAKEYGFSRVVLARETPLSDIRRISKIIETEVFIQGALCTCFSGQCYLSSFAGNNSGNRGRCKQPCRKRYSFDREGYEDQKYALSVSDLSVRERVKELISAGVYSFKIEGRLRRVEYVRAAVSYYRALLDGKDGAEGFLDLKRTYNRGDYTFGLAFGQNKDFLSRDVQGHIGEEAGTVSFVKGKPYCKSIYRANLSDGFKILRNGEEVGGARAERTDGKGFYLSSKERLVEGDHVRLTTDSKLSEKTYPARKKRIALSLRFCAGELPSATCGEFEFTGGTPLERAKNSPLTEEELKACFQKTDGLPLQVEFLSVVTEGAFLPKSSLNAFRRAFYEELFASERRIPLKSRTPEEVELTPQKGGMTAVIAENFEGLQADILIFKPQNYDDLSGIQKGKGRKFLYLPPYLRTEEYEALGAKSELFEGVYAEGYYGVEFARRYNKALFAGTGFHLANRFALEGVQRAGAEYFALSKELTDSEQRELSARGAFALTAGGIKVMDLIYCPFEKTCAKCDKKHLYHMTDEEWRTFPVRRYEAGGNCRFEVYNCVELAAYNGTTNALVDLSAGGERELVDAAFDPQKVKRIEKNTTSGHSIKSLL